jgi:hypothetical protein
VKKVRAWSPPAALREPVWWLRVAWLVQRARMIQAVLPE